MKIFFKLIITALIITAITNCSREEQYNTEEQTEQPLPRRKITPNRYYIENNAITTATTDFDAFENEEESAADSGQVYISSIQESSSEIEQATDFDLLNVD